MHDWSGSSLAALPIAAEISPDLVVLKVSGPSRPTRRLGLRGLRGACPAGGAEVVITQLCAVVNLLAQGRAPDYVAPVLAGAGLVALRKPNAGVRPIAVGEILRRLTSKCLMALVRDDAQAFFYPAQVGVAVPGGVEKVIHIVRAWWHRHQCSR